MQILKQDHQNESKSNGDSQTAERGEAMSHQINLERASVSGGQQHKEQNYEGNEVYSTNYDNLARLQ